VGGGVGGDSRCCRAAPPGSGQVAGQAMCAAWREQQQGVPRVGARREAAARGMDPTWILVSALNLACCSDTSMVARVAPSRPSQSGCATSWMEGLGADGLRLGRAELDQYHGTSASAASLMPLAGAGSLASSWSRSAASGYSQMSCGTLSVPTSMAGGGGGAGGAPAWRLRGMRCGCASWPRVPSWLARRAHIRHLKVYMCQCRPAHAARRAQAVWCHPACCTRRAARRAGYGPPCVRAHGRASPLEQAAPGASLLAAERPLMLVYIESIEA
jgi:hypothetical protein